MFGFFVISDISKEISSVVQQVSIMANNAYDKRVNYILSNLAVFAVDLSILTDNSLTEKPAIVLIILSFSSRIFYLE